ncbi:uncharacterized protein MELLADRAFT_30091, partial [Melampsora larici-populina 98AG31]
ILNVWRPIQPVSDNPLGLCEWSSLSPPDDTLEYGVEPTTASNSIQPWKYKEGQKWWYLSNMRPDEAYVFMQHDNTAKNGHGINVPHASFKMVTDDPNISQRSSVECRVMAFFEPLP